ncbi:MAG: Gfo/Idh/MocA family protein [Phycisphaerales bacterium]
MSSSDAFRLAVIGAGGISGAHSGAAKASEGRVQIVAVADPATESRNKLASAWDAHAFDSAEALLKAASAGLQVDGVVVCTPPSARLKIVADCLKAKLPVLSEKPLAHTLADAKKLAALAAKAKKVPAFVAYCHRFAPPVNAMKRLLEDGKIGRLSRFENAFACDLPGHQTKWFSEPKKAGGGAFLDMGSHSLDLFHYIVGPAAAAGAVLDHKWSKRTETGATVLVRGLKKRGANVPAGVAGSILSGWAETSRFTLTLVGDQGTLFYDYEQPTTLIFKDLVGKTETHEVASHDSRFTLQLLAFAEAATSKKKTSLATFADGLAAAALNDKAQKLSK